MLLDIGQQPVIAAPQIPQMLQAELLKSFLILRAGQLLLQNARADTGRVSCGLRRLAVESTGRRLQIPSFIFFKPQERTGRIRRRFSLMRQIDTDGVLRVFNIKLRKMRVAVQQIIDAAGLQPQADA